MKFFRVNCFLLMTVAFGAISTLWGCSSMESVGMARGRFAVSTYSDFRGAGRNLPQDSDYTGISFSGSYATRTEIPMDASNKKNDQNEELNSKVDFAYVQDKIQGHGTVDRIFKGQYAMSGYSIGMTTHPTLFSRFFVGVNDVHYEVGVFGSIEFGKMSGGYSVFKYDDYFGYPDSSLQRVPISEVENSLVTEGAGGFASFFIDRLAVTSTMSIYNSWVGEKDHMNLTFDMPYLYSVYVGASYWISSRFKLGLGVTNIINADRRSMSLDGSLGYWR